MPVKVITTEKGHSVPPEGPHTVTMHIPGWDTAMNFRSGDRSLLTIMTSIYPRFMPFSLAGKVSKCRSCTLPSREGPSNASVCISVCAGGA